MGNEITVCIHGAYQKPLTCQKCEKEGQLIGAYGTIEYYPPTIAKISNEIDAIPVPPVAAKNDQEKPDLSLVPKEALEAAARAFMVGQKKYGRYNYYKGHKASQLIAALIRHATAWMDGEENDPQDGQPHLGSVIACAAMLLKQKALGTLIDDRHKPDSK